MIWKLREMLGNYSLKEKQSKFKTHGLPNWNSSLKCVVFVSLKSMGKANLKKISASLKSMGLNQVQFITFCRSSKKAMELNFTSEVTILNSKDMAFNLLPKSPFKFDLVVDLTTEEELPMKLAMLHTQANHFIGIQREWNKAILDFMIQDVDNKPLDYLVDQLVVYLKQINTNNNAA